MKRSVRWILIGICAAVFLVCAVYGDKLITLATCEYSQNEGRLVVVAKQVG